MQYKALGAETELTLDIHGILLLACVEQYSLGCFGKWAQSQIWVVKQ